MSLPPRLNLLALFFPLSKSISTEDALVLDASGTVYNIQKTLHHILMTLHFNIINITARKLCVRILYYCPTFEAGIPLDTPPAFSGVPEAVLLFEAAAFPPLSCSLELVID